MSLVKFYYVPDPYLDPVTNQRKEILRPKIPIRLAYEHKLSKVLVDCLIDSGSDTNLFPADWGRSVGIRIEKGDYDQIRGIGDVDIDSYIHKVGLYIGSKRINVNANFSDEQNVPLLGRQGFFDQFPYIKFNEKSKYVEIKV